MTTTIETVASSISRANSPTARAPETAPAPQLDTKPAERAITDTAYISPAIRFDTAAQIAVFMYRDSTTGDVQRQYPSKTQIEAYQQERAQVAVPQFETEPAPETTETEAPKPAPSANSESIPVDATTVENGSIGSDVVSTSTDLQV